MTVKIQITVRSTK